MNHTSTDEHRPPGIGITYESSQASRTDAGPPNGPDVVVIMFDDLGFGDLGCFGSEVQTPNLDALANSGHRYNNFHATTLCAPSRACLLSGRNHHAVGMRMLTGARYDWPSGQERISHEAGLFSEVLRDAGWNTFAAGKWHVLPQDHQGPSGPYEHWPLGRGFNRFYGFLGGAANHYYPELVHDNHHIDPPSSPEDGYHLTEDLIDKSCGFISDHLAHRASNPFLLYLPLGAPHAPHHAPQEFMERVRGRYDEGWDEIRKTRYERQLAEGIIPPGTELPPSNPDARPWDTLSPVEQQVAARFQEAYAAFIEHTDHTLGRLFDFLKRAGRWENTLVVVCSDNGAAMDGGDLGIMSRIHFFNNVVVEPEALVDRLGDVGSAAADSQYARGWAQASNTPLKWYKRYTHGGGVRVPLIVNWNDRLKAPGSILPQFHHLIDIAPTIYEAAGITPPPELAGHAQLPLNGRSMGYTFDEPAAPTTRRRQYFEMTGHRGIWAEGWKAVTRHELGSGYEKSEWELYNLDQDYSESNNLASTESAKLDELINLWWHEAGANAVLPLDDRYMELFREYRMDERSPLYRKRVDYYPPLSHIERPGTPPLENCSFRIEAGVSGTMEGVILAYGNSASGFTLYVQDNELHFEYNAAGPVIHEKIEIPPSPSALLWYEFELGPERSGRGRLGVDDAQTDWFEFEHVLAFVSLAGMDVGRDGYEPVSPNYSPPFPFKGELARVSILTGPEINPVPRQRDDY